MFPPPFFNMPRRKATDTETEVVVDDPIESSSGEDNDVQEVEALAKKKTRTKKKQAKRKASASASASAPASASAAASASTSKAKKPAAKKSRARGGGSAVSASEAREKLAGHATLPEDLRVGMRISNVETMRVKGIGKDQRTQQPCFDMITDNKKDGFVRVMMSVFGTTYKSPDVCKETVYCSRTNIVRILRTRVHSHLFWVKFIKQPKKGEAVGEERSMYARLVDGVDDCFGRSVVLEQVVDDPKKITYQRRLVDHRTLQEFKFDGIHYIVK